MCIRDSVRTDWAAKKALVLASSDLPDLFFGRYALTASDIPVSYTHLRAHETVLDLVCRLLLEKKKN